jgi:hypothetical protein
MMNREFRLSIATEIKEKSMAYASLVSPALEIFAFNAVNELVAIAHRHRK